MPNTTTIAITSFSGEIGVPVFIKQSGLPLQQLINDNLVETGYVVSMELWALSVRSLSGDEILRYLELYRSIAFEFPENVCMIVDCDDNEAISGCYPLVVKEHS